VRGRVECGDWRREQSGRGKALWKGLWVRVEGGGEVIRRRGGRERLLAVDDSAGVCDCRLGHTSTGQSIKYPDTWRQG